ncbi:tRNA(Met) cytidine acetyltransferase [Pyrococcus furiosus DSM 3638]|uniref:tRNA(Met) cytidine acetyltransferase TmcA n=3 Tax=Pyrococcus furiosus TaxID=2261 RepID=TMCA_PYRFU|nr:tRNA(Met) cytidine acetyltransferase TmcA [Pyrococcus furiosus]AAL80628.1 DNA helicase [Pyrococcus furiosus DSM 3638]AFN03299.1 DNA helicase [Pyrococcus furiosus COM1]QEK78217.1 tRNA(Met) cytidine acetyltransferase [Pyrococcus furiosus DSM 3638]
MTVKVKFPKDIREYARKEKVKDSLIKLTETALAEAISKFHRRMIVLQGDTLNKAKLAGILAGGAARILSEYIPEMLERKLRDTEQIEVLYATDALGEDTYGRKRFEEFRKHFSLLAPTAELTSVTFKHSRDILGRTFDILVIDLSYDYSPNDLGRIIETVRGGGLIFVLTNPFEKWKDMWTGFHKSLVTPPYTIEDVKKRFNRRLIRKFTEHKGIYIVNTDRMSIERKPGKYRSQATLPEREKVEIPKNIRFPRELYELCLTRGQVEVLKTLEELIEKEGMVVLTADRGRGKSVSIGIASVGLAVSSKKKRFRIVVTAPEPENVQSLMKFAKKSLEVLGYKTKVITDNGLIKEVYAKGIGIRYYPPTKGYRQRAELYIVDEAAGIHVPILHRYLEKERVVFSSTIHGYEGAGRGFSVKFLKKAKEKREYKEVHLSTPIRYAEGDPIEKWLFDVLLLDAEPVELTEEDYELIRKMEVYLEEPDLDDWFENDREDLRHFVGIYVLAHYRNRPSDVALLADAPHHEARVLRLKNGKIVTAIQIAKEGGIPKAVIDKMAKGYKPPGNIIPDMMVKHHYAKEFARLKGYRVVRIATHPDAMDMGLGSKALELLIKEAEEKGLDWVGSGFGASPELIRFWVRNGFAVVHLSPTRNPVSGEYTAIVIKPISEKAKEIVKKANEEFRIRLTEWLGDTHRDLEPEIARWLFESPFGEAVNYPIYLTKTQKRRLEMFIKRILTYDTVVDAVKPLVKLYFLDGWMRPYLDERQIMLLIHRVLQAHDWKETAKLLNRTEMYTMVELRDIVRGLWYYYKHLIKDEEGEK